MNREEYEDNLVRNMKAATNALPTAQRLVDGWAKLNQVMPSVKDLIPRDAIPCPQCGFPTEHRACAPFCHNCGFKGVCGDSYSS